MAAEGAAPPMAEDAAGAAVERDVFALGGIERKFSREADAKS